MNSIKDIYGTDSIFLRAADLKGQRPTVQISDFEIGEVGDEKKKQVILFFAGQAKKLGLNKTNAERIAVLSGSYNPVDWIGAKIRLFVDPNVSFQGKKVDAVRVSQEFYEAPSSQTQTQSPTDDGQINF